MTYTQLSAFISAIYTDCAGEKLVVVETPMEKQANDSFETMVFVIYLF